MAFRTDYVLRKPAWRRLHDGPMPVRTHTGAGDFLLQAGLMVKLNERYGSIAVPCYHKYWELGQTAFAAYPHIHLYEIPDQHPGHLCSPPDATFDEAYKKAGLDKAHEMRIGDYAGEGLFEDFAKGFYCQAGVEYYHRWFSDPTILARHRVRQREWSTDSRIFVHDDPSRGHVITKLVDRSTTYFPPFTGNILEFAYILLTAEEIHAIDSAFFCFANQLPLLKRVKLFYHHYARPERDPKFRHELPRNWEYVL